MNVPTGHAPLRILGAALVAPSLVLGIGLATASSAAAAAQQPADQAASSPSPVYLGGAARFAVLAASTVTNAGPSRVSGDLGVSPGTAVTGFPPGIVSNGVIRADDGLAVKGHASLATAYADAAARTPTAQVTTDLGGTTLMPGVYHGATLGIHGTLTLNANGDSDAVFVFQASTTLITGSYSSVVLVGDANASNVFWQVGSSATLGTYTSFQGTVMAYASVTDTTGTSVVGRLLAKTAAVTLHADTVTRPGASPEASQ